MVNAKLMEFEVIAPVVAINAAGSATVLCSTDQQPIQLNLAADVLLFLQEQIAKGLAEARHGGLRMLPTVEACNGLEGSIDRSQLQIRLVLEGGSEARLPIHESALAKLNAVLTGWCSEQRD
jgi:hypothetical protein